MNRRSFLQFLGLAPVVAPAALAAMPAGATIVDWGRMTPEVAAAAVDLWPGLPTTTFRAVNAELLYGRSPIVDALPAFRQWNFDKARYYSEVGGLARWT